MYMMRCAKCRKQTIHEDGQCLKCGLITSQHPELEFNKSEKFFSADYRKKTQNTQSSSTSIKVTYLIDDD